VKSKQLKDLLDNLKETFNNLCKYHMMLNLRKCIFGVSIGKLLSYMVSAWRIDVKPKMVEAIVGGEPSLMGEGYLERPLLFGALFSRVFSCFVGGQMY
jgi:hypothetical protein